MKHKVFKIFPWAIYPLKCNLLRKILNPPILYLHSSVQTALGSVEQLTTTQNFMPHGILGTYFFTDPMQHYLHRGESNINTLGPNLYFAL